MKPRARFTFVRLLAALFALLIAWLVWVVFIPVDLPNKPYHVVVGANSNMRNLAGNLADDGAIRNRWVMLALSRLDGLDRKIKPGLYIFEERTSMWQMLQRFAAGSPNLDSITVVEGMTFRQFRAILNREKDLRHDTRNMSDAEILAAVGSTDKQAGGWFFPSTYFFAPGSSDLEVLRQANRTMQQELQNAWQRRREGLPYATPYDMLIMASLIEKETSKEEDRPLVASVFVNRLSINMRLQTDPTIIYGMGSAYRGNITRADLRRDTPYNTYTRAGLTPTPISLPGRASLDAAANPAESKALYFVARGDGSSHFSETLDEHNAAVRKYILKKGS